METYQWYRDEASRREGETSVVLDMLLRVFPYKRGSLSGEVSGFVDVRHREHMCLSREVYVLDGEGNDWHGRCSLVEGNVLDRPVDRSHDPWPYHQICSHNTVSLPPAFI